MNDRAKIESCVEEYISRYELRFLPRGAVVKTGDKYGQVELGTVLSNVAWKMEVMSHLLGSRTARCDVVWAASPFILLYFITNIIIICMPPIKVNVLGLSIENVMQCVAIFLKFGHYFVIYLNCFVSSVITLFDKTK